jgi:hypothetical protein
VLCASPSAARQLGRERVESRLPEPAVRPQPVVELAQRRGINGVEATIPVGADGGEPVRSKHPEVPGDRRLADAELSLDHRADRACHLLPVDEDVEDAAADRIAEDIERVHAIGI